MATAARNLRTGRPIWLGRHAPSVPVNSLTRDIATDVLILGAGITGAMVADALTSEDVAVTVVDKRGPAKGSTVASTALVQYEIDTPLTTLTRKIGKHKAVRAWRRSRLAVDALAARLNELKVAGVMRRDSLYIAGNTLGIRELRHEHEARRAGGLPTRFLDAGSLRNEYGIARKAALKGYGNLVLDPRKTTLALLQAATARGARVFSPFEIIEVEPGRSRVTAVAGNGRRISCRQLVFATGYELPQGVPHRHHKITSTWAIATVPQARERLWPGECCIWEAADPYLYVRTSEDGRVICGGEDEDFSDEDARDALLNRKTAILRRKLHRLLPKLDTTIAFRWTGTFGETTTGLPIIDRIPGMPHCWVALGYGGNGTTYAAIAANVIAGAICGRPDVDADLYRFPARPKAK